MKSFIPVKKKQHIQNREEMSSLLSMERSFIPVKKHPK
jgi:hypothetical protein